jgi:hypothetical protein
MPLSNVEPVVEALDVAVVLSSLSPSLQDCTINNTVEHNSINILFFIALNYYFTIKYS